MTDPKAEWVTLAEEETTIASMPPAERGMYDAIIERVCRDALAAEARAKAEWEAAHSARVESDRIAFVLASLPQDIEGINQQLDDLRGQMGYIHRHAAQAARPWWEKLFG